MPGLRKIKSNESLISYGPTMARDGGSRSLEKEDGRDGFDVFLNFRGEDSRKDIADYIYQALNIYEVKVFRDEEGLPKGEDIDSELLENINKSRIAIAIFSKTYASSRACLLELAEIMKCRKTQDLQVLPVFFMVEPSELRKDNGTFMRAMQSHGRKYGAKIMETWKEALKQVSKMKGWTVKDNSHKGEIAMDIAMNVMGKLASMSFSRMVVDDHLVGIDKHAREVMRRIEDNSKLHIVGIHGVAGVGKTTLAKSIYDKLSVQNFDYRSFISQDGQTLTPAEKIEFFQQEFVGIDRTITLTKKNSRNSEKKVLLVIDDIDDTYQMGLLMRMCTQFSSGSNILLTTRNSNVVNVPQVTTKYELDIMSTVDSLKLFSKHAFGNDEPPKPLYNCSTNVVSRSGRLPLHLKDIGSLLCGKNKEEWTSTLHKLASVEFGDGDRYLANLYELLNEKEKHIFLDVACFFIGYDKRMAIYMWEDLELSPKETLDTLERLSLVQIDDTNMIQMDDKVKDFARRIAEMQNDLTAEKSTRLWNHEKAILMLKGSKGDQEVLAQYANFDPSLEYYLRSDDFGRLPNLRFLHVNSGAQTSDFQGSSISQAILPSDSQKRNDGIFSNIRWLSWHGFPPSLNVTIFAQMKLVILDLSWSRISSDWEGWKHIEMAEKLKVLNLTGCSQLTQSPKFSALKGIERLIFEGCQGLVEIDQSIGDLQNLIHLNLIGCSNLQQFPQKVTSLESLQELLIDETAIRALPSCDMKNLEILSAPNCLSLSTCNSLQHLASLKHLSFRGCRKIEELPSSTENLTSLVELDISKTNFKELPHSIRNLKELKVLRMDNSGITKLPNAIGHLEKLEELHADSCDAFKGRISRRIEQLQLLRIFILAGDSLSGIPTFPQSLVQLRLYFDEIEAGDLDLSHLVQLRDLVLEFRRISIQTEESCLGGIGSLSKLESLALSLPNTTNLPQDLPPSLKKLNLYGCDKIDCIESLPSGLALLKVQDCMSMRKLPDLSNFKFLTTLVVVRTKVSQIEGLGSLRKLDNLEVGSDMLSSLDGLECLENLVMLLLESCGSLKILPELSKLKKLKQLKISNCQKLVDIQAKLVSLEVLSIKDCPSLERIPDLSNMKMLKFLLLENCKKLQDLVSIDELSYLKSLMIRGYVGKNLRKKCQYIKRLLQGKTDLQLDINVQIAYGRGLGVPLYRTILNWTLRPVGLGILLQLALLQIPIYQSITLKAMESSAIAVMVLFAAAILIRPDYGIYVFKIILSLLWAIVKNAVEAQMTEGLDDDRW